MLCLLIIQVWTWIRHVTLAAGVVETPRHERNLGFDTTPDRYIEAADIGIKIVDGMPVVKFMYKAGRYNLTDEYDA